MFVCGCVVCIPGAVCVTGCLACVACVTGCLCNWLPVQGYTCLPVLALLTPILQLSLFLQCFLSVLVYTQATSKLLPLPRLMTLTTQATHIENNYWSYYHDITTITARTMNVFLRSSTLVVSYSPHQSALTCGGKHIPAKCEPTLHICDIGMASTLQHGVHRHCLTFFLKWQRALDR